MHLLVNNFKNHIFVRKSHKIGIFILHFGGICFKFYVNLTITNGNIKGSKKDSKDQESIQSSTTPVPEYQIGK